MAVQRIDGCHGPRVDRLARTKQTMADEKPRKARKTTTRAPRKRAGSPNPGEAVNEAAATESMARNSETPVLAIEQSTELEAPASDHVDEIRLEAYVLYLSRGGSDGNDLSDWLEAERIVRLRRGGAESTDPDRH